MLSKERTVKSPRNAYGETLCALGEIDKNIVVLDADLAASTQSGMFGKKFPERFFDVGIAEQDMISQAAGFALTGKTAFASTFAVFATGRCYDQIRASVAYSNLDVKIIGTHAGITVGEDGATHQANEDIALMRSLPNMTVLAPSDYYEVKACVEYAYKTKGPFYIRIPRTNTETIFSENYKHNPDSAVKLSEGTDVLVCTTGENLANVVDAVELLKEKGISATLLHIPQIKPFLAKDDIINSAKACKKVVTIENHSIIGGLGSAICEVLSENYPTPVLRIGINDCFGQSGRAEDLVKYYKLDSNSLLERIMEFIK